MTNLFDKTTNRLSKLRRKILVQIRDGDWGTYNTNNQTELKSTMLKSSVTAMYISCIPLKRTIADFRQEGDTKAKAADTNKKGEMFKNCAVFTACVSELNNEQTDNPKDLHVVMSICHLIEYSR